MKTLKKLILLCLCVSFAFTLCACGCDGDGSTGDDGGLSNGDNVNATKIYEHDLTSCWEVNEDGVEIGEKSLHDLEDGVCKICGFTDLQTAIENTKKATKFFESNFTVNMVDYATGENNPGFWRYECTENQFYESYIVKKDGVMVEKINYILKNPDGAFNIYQKIIKGEDEEAWKAMPTNGFEDEALINAGTFYNMVEMGCAFVGVFEIEEYCDNVYKMKAPAGKGEPGWNRYEITVKDGLVIKTICYLYEFEFSFGDAVVDIPDLVS